MRHGVLARLARWAAGKRAFVVLLAGVGMGVAALGVVGENKALAQVASEADTRLRQVLASVESAVAT